MKTFIILLSLIVALAVQSQDHGHINIGSTGINQNDPLIFDNAAIFETATNYVKTLTLATSGAYAGYYQGSIAFTGLAATEPHAGPVANAAALGSQLHAQLVAVTGPAGGVFSLWDTGATNPTISLTAGSTGTNTWIISENDGSPGSDPYGHIHGRRFTATKPGIYTVSFRAVDFSTNGPGGTPIHTPSAVMQVYFQAGVNIKSIKPDVEHTYITFAAPLGKSWVVEASSSVESNAVWTTIGVPVVGDDYFHEITDDEPVTGNRFYRTRGF
jgi:hypothetical protein